MSRALPNNWILLAFDEAKIQSFSGAWGNSSETPGHLVKVIRNGDIDPSGKISRELPTRSLTDRELRKSRLSIGDILVTTSGDVGKVAIWNSQGGGVAASNFVRVLRSSGPILPEWLYYFLRTMSARRVFEGNSRGSTIKNLQSSVWKEITVPTPSIPEQEAILTKLKSLIGRIEMTQKRLESIAILMKRFRKSVLATGFSGRLTEEWRAENPNIEPACDLLARIKAERLLGAQSNKEKRQIEEAFYPGSNSASSELSESIQYPESWSECRIGMIGTVVNGSTPSRNHPEYWKGNIGWVSSGEVRNNLIARTRECITSAGYKNSSVRLLPRGTVLLAMIGEGKTRGQSAILNIEATINQNVAAVIINHGLVEPEYLWWWFQYQYEATRAYGSGSGPQALNCQGVRQLPFILPPLSEQREITAQLKLMFGAAEKVGARLNNAKARAARLSPSILSLAFSGRLIS